MLSSPNFYFGFLKFIIVSYNRLGPDKVWQFFSFVGNKTSCTFCRNTIRPCGTAWCKKNWTLQSSIRQFQTSIQLTGHVYPLISMSWKIGWCYSKYGFNVATSLPISLQAQKHLMNNKNTNINLHKTDLERDKHNTLRNWIYPVYKLSTHV
jgi:hypothetical protein